MDRSEKVYGQGSIDNVIKRIGVNKSNVFAVGNDPVTQSGIIVSEGKVVSSKILDITIKSGKNNIVMSSSDEYLNKVIVKYVSSDTKRIETQSFDILNTDALLETIKLIQKFDDVVENVSKIEEKQAIFDEKLRKIQLFLDENKNQIGCIGMLKDQIIDLTNKVDVLLTEREIFNNNHHRS